MPHSSVFLNAKQLDVLGWIADGCPPREWSDYAHRITTRALADRGLVIVSGRGKSWTATITEAGAERHAELRAQAEAQVDLHEAAELLLRSVIEAGGSLIEGPLRMNASELVALALESPIRPRGKQLRFRHLGSIFDRTRDDRVEWALVDYFPDQFPLREVSIPGKPDTPSGIVRDFKNSSARARVTEGQVPRACGLLAALDEALSQSGFQMSIEAGNHRTGVIRADQDHLEFQLKEIGRSDRAWLMEERRRQRRPSERSISDGAKSTGRLELTLGSYGDGRPTTFRDAGKLTLESQLPLFVQEVEVQRAERKARRSKEALALEVAKTRWEATLAQAEFDLQRDAKKETLKRQAESWKEAVLIREYASAMDTASREGTEDQKCAVEDWVRWARDRADELDPTTHLDELRIPSDVDFSRADLRPYMNGMNPDGPPTGYLPTHWSH